MKPTLDEEITEIAKDVAIRARCKGFDATKQVKSSIYAGIEAWKRQEPDDEMVMAGIDAYENGLIATKQSRIHAIYRAMMSASLRTSETTGGLDE